MITGNRARLSCLFQDTTGAAFSPTTVQLVIKQPDGSKVNVTGGSVVADGGGNFHYDFLTSIVGLHTYSWQSLAVGQEIKSEGSFVVDSSTVLP